MTKISVPCPRCNHTGFVSPRLSRGNDGDICYECKGACKINVDDVVTAARKEATRRKRKAMKTAARNATRGPEIACHTIIYLGNPSYREWIASYYDLYDAVKEIDRIRREQNWQPADRWTIIESTQFADCIG